ncbi:restriction endonuclease subunit S [Salinibacterium sp. SYSU T00001]|uniref:restriction endonuclease subunit S n=1 Tax=Homoserinimonas sedimenticola TaxID=2986805 RepID=UPI002235B019|nr:restriction endonuclease subunit S [Salinibacterium sedimenticola]MCW4384466.1 restriction endonuclease subunit S [Salinibacterium sedimenticola]
MTELKPYPEYKDSGVEWLGRLPVDWDICAVGRFVHFRNGADYASVEVEEGGYPVYGSGGEFRRASSYLFEGESVLFGRKGTVDKPLHVNGRFWTVDTMYYTDISTNHLLPRFVYYWAAQLPYAYWVTSTALPSMTQSDLATAKIPYMSLADQAAIVKFLDRETAEIDAFIANQEELIRLLTERRAATISHAVTKGLDPTAPTRDSGIEWLGSIPRHWEVRRIKQVGRSLIGLTYSPDDLTESDDGTIVLRSGNIKRGLIDISTDVVRVSSLIPAELRTREGDILICARNGSRALVGKNAIITDVTVGETFGAFMSVLRTRDYRFMSWVLNSSLFSSQMGLFSTSTVNQLTRSTLDNMEIPWPDTAERKRISDELEEEVGELDAAVADGREAIALSRERRAALISAAVTGKIDVRDGQA